MFNVFLTVNPDTGFALYRDQYKFLGCFQSLTEASKKIGRDVFDRFCEVYSIDFKV